ncbi:putative nepenthesin [Dioscorea sansibarensis]
MDRRRIAGGCFVFLLVFVVFESGPVGVSGNGVFKVQHKFFGRRRVEELRAHDARRHGRFLSAADLPMGGVGVPTSTGLYFAQIGLGSPSKNYYVQVDTGSDILWVNCVTCQRCPKKSDIEGVELTLFDPKGSSTAKYVSCDQNFCSSMYGGDIPGCTPDLPCQYSVSYGDGSTSSGSYVTDVVQYNQVTGDHQTKPANGSVTFGCGAQQSADLGSSGEALDGILGFGQANSSMLSQLASAGKVKKVFSHCLDTTNGGGIFAIGHVVEPKVKTTPLVPDQPHYNVNLKAIEVGGSFLTLPTDLFETGEKKGTIIDSGTTLAYLPETAYKLLMPAIFSYQPDLSFHTVQDFLCFRFFGNVDDGFPDVIFHFENSLLLTVYPRDYLFENQDGVWCVGWQNSGVQSRDGRDIALLGDLVLSNKLVIYDLENQNIGWTEYNCSSSIKVRDDKSGAVYSVNSHNISASSRLDNSRLTILLLVTALLCRLLY